MNTDKSSRWVSFILTTFLFGALFALYGISIKRAALQLEEKRFQTEQTEKLITSREQAARGFPAPESEIVAGKYYFCDAALTDQWSDRVLNYLVLQEMTTDGKRWKILVGKKRLFQVNSTVPSSQFYLAERTNGILTLKRIGPVPPSIPEAKEPPISSPTGVDLRI